MSMRVFISSTPVELEVCRGVAVDVARELGLQPLLRRPGDGGAAQAVAACLRQVATADLMLAIVGHRRGRVPPPELGGDGLHPWAWWETRTAFEHGLPVAVLMAADGWASAEDEDDARDRSVMQDFRGELERLAVAFGDDPEGFRDLVRGRLMEAQRLTTADTGGAVRLRDWAPPGLPDRPYPVLLPYRHPDLLGGRERALGELRGLLARPVPILGLYAASGCGKSSLLAGGLVPELRAEGRPVAMDRHPGEAGLAGRLLADLIAGDIELDDENLRVFADRLLAIRRVAEVAPVLILDQFEELLRDEAPRRPRAVAGALLAASVQRQPGLSEAPCRWILAYRQEFHGQVVQWLGDVLRDAVAEDLPAVATLPNDLGQAERFQGWSLAPLGTPAPGSDDPVADAAASFLAAITKPTAHYPLAFAPGVAEGLARAFGEARVRSPRSPLAPELQVTLAHLLAASPHRGQDPVVIEGAEDPGVLIEEALEAHLQRALEAAFPGGRHRRGRSRALLALRELADESGRRNAGLQAGTLAQAIGSEGREVLEKLATAETRVVVPQGQGDERFYVLSHDRMAEIVVRLFEEGRFAALEVDEELLDLRRFVALHSELYAAGEVDQATAMPKRPFQRIGGNAEALLWDEEQRRWWRSCRQRRRRDRRRRWLRSGLAVALVVAVGLVASSLAARRAERRGLLDEVARGEPEAALAAIERLAATAAADDEELRAALFERYQFDILQRGLGGVPEERRGRAVLRLAELVMPFVAQSPEDPELIAPLAWALDFFAREPALAERARKLRREALRELRRRHPPPPPPAAGDPNWAEIPAGSFRMGTVQRPVEISAFRIQVREVSVGEYRRLVPDFLPGLEDELPALTLSWMKAYTYAAWLGGRLPTEAEWEYTARAGCPTTYCKRDGSEAWIGEVGRWLGNAFDARQGGLVTALPMQYQPNPWGLFDMYGNVEEWTADLFADLPNEPARDPIGPIRSATGRRTTKGGHFAGGPEQCSPHYRAGLLPTGEPPFWGFRVVLPD